MRLVRYDPQERVDLPDITAMTALVLGEFRRTVRGLVIGPDTTGAKLHENYIIRGFAPEASAVPDTLVTVRLVPTTGGGRPLGVAMGGEDFATHVDHGQLIGSEDSAQNTEGNATTSFDFTGQPVGTYRLQMRFVYQDGANDNRAFWDAATNTEFIAAVDTRALPAIELNIAVSPASLGDDWIPLADVVWGGATVTAGNITDVRPFIFEGVTGTFEGATQAAYTALPDYSRSTLREGALVGVNEIYPVLRALGRQIADIKGQDESGNFNWYQRVYGPTDALDALADEQTRSLRTVDTVMYTIGDGTTTFGDFNGAGGLDACLAHLISMGANCPNSVEIVCKSRITSAPAPFTWNITTARVLPASCDRLSIDMQGHIIAFSHTAATSGIDVTGELEVRNLGTASTANNATLFEATQLLLFNCTMVGDSTASAEAVVDGGQNSRIEGCTITGRVRFTNPQITAGGGVTQVGDVWVRDSSFVGCVEVSNAGATELPMPLRMSGCRVTSIASHAYNGLGAAIFVGNNSFSHICDTHVTWHGDSKNGIEITDSSSNSPEGCTIQGCKIDHVTSAAAAVGGTWAIRVATGPRHNISDTVVECVDARIGGIAIIGGADQCSIRGCQIRGLDVTGRPAISQCAIYLLGSVTNLVIQGNHIDGWEPNAAVGAGRCIIGGASASALAQIIIDGNTFRSNGGYAVQLGDNPASVDSCVISNNSVYVPEAAGFGFDVEGWTRGAITGNVIRVTTGSSSGIFGGGTGDCIVSGNRLHNAFLSTTGAVMYGFSGGGGPTNLNYVT